MVIVKVILIFMSVCSFVVYGQSELYIEDSSLKDKTCSENDLIFTVNDTNTMQCAVFCEKNPFCFGFIFHSSDGKCVACQGGDGNLISADVGTQYFGPNHATWGLECNASITCAGNNQQCLEGVCVCTSGYSYNAISSICQAGYPQYGNTFQRYKGVALRENNFVELFDDVTLSDCIDACLASTMPLCTSFEHSDDLLVCFLQAVTFVDEPQAYFENQRFNYYNRNC